MKEVIDTTFDGKVEGDFLRSQILKETVDLLGRIIVEFKGTQTITSVTYGNAQALGQLIAFYLKEKRISHEQARERRFEND